ncbi:hypothetical protein [Kaistia adipata]|uniref:hypothetical protein n=1 Tax=Kaistia adipata TaxID=166954 RepID=UPI0003FBA154|nr:hypothetical protein [Kaistia adipata]
MATEPIHELKLGISGYIAEMTKDLKGLATNAEFEFLAYLLSVAEEEARGIHRTMRSRLASATADFEFSPSPDDA